MTSMKKVGRRPPVLHKRPAARVPQWTVEPRGQWDRDAPALQGQ
jgi:hypothetical protein